MTVPPNQPIGNRQHGIRANLICSVMNMAGQPAASTRSVGPV